MKLKIILLCYVVCNMCYGQFRFTRSLPDPFYKAVILCSNDNVSDISKNGWGCSESGITRDNTIAKFGNNSGAFNLVTTTTNVNFMNGAAANNNPLRVGAALTAYPFIGYMQNIKFSTIARYTSDFNPNKPY